MEADIQVVGPSLALSVNALYYWAHDPQGEDKKADIHAAADRGERVAAMEPMLVAASSPHRAARAPRILDALLYRGELPRSELAATVATGDRQARRIVAELMARGALVSESPRAPVRLAFSAALAERWMPGLFPPPRR